MSDISYFVEQHPQSVASVFLDYDLGHLPVTEETLAAAFVAFGPDLIEDIEDEISGFSGPEFSNLTGAEKRAAKKAARVEKRENKKAEKQAKKDARKGVFKETIAGPAQTNTLDIINTVGQYAGAVGGAVGAVGGAASEAIAAGQGIAAQVRGGTSFAPADPAFNQASGTSGLKGKKWLPWAIGGGVFLLLSLGAIILFTGKKSGK